METKEEYMSRAKKVAGLIKNSSFFKKFGYKGTWLSGSSTPVHPISHWVENRQFVIQLNDNYRGKTQSAKSLIGKIEEICKIKYWGYGDYDGSCPRTLYINLW